VRRSGSFSRWIFWLAVFLVVAPGAEARNLLGGEASPYLRGHAADPVHWRPWNDAAFALARRTGKPILLSIGYAACHWCHVMQRESFQDEAIAGRINDLFVPVLVDREERPDIDAVYQAAATAMGVHAGWPLTLFLTANGEPFLGGAYFPREPAPGLPSFLQMAERAAAAHGADPDATRATAAALLASLAPGREPDSGTLAMADVDAAAELLLGRIDVFEGGFGHGRKHPRVPALNLLWRAFLRSGDTRYSEAVIDTLDAMGRGGLYDHLGGGFFRYTVDAGWSQPHFEKMLDINAGMLALMTEVWKETGSPFLERRVRETVAFLLAEMRLPGGAFAASLDADSRRPGGGMGEGVYYRWTGAEVRRLLGAGAGAFLGAYEIVPLAEDASGVLVGTGDRDGRRSDLEILRKYRSGRPRPERNDTVLAHWNGLAVAALAEAGFAFGEDRWIAAAGRALAFARDNLTDSRGAPRHSRIGARLGPAATVEDYGFLSAAALTLSDVGGEGHWVNAAAAWAEAAIARLWDGADGGFFFVGSEDPTPPVRSKPFLDGPAPSGNAVMAAVMARLFYRTGEDRWRQSAERTVVAFSGAPRLRLAGLFNAVETLHGTVQVVIVGRRGEAATDVLLKQVAGTALPARVLQVIAPGTPLPESHPAAHKGQIDGRATAYVCRGPLCSLPTSDPAALGRALKSMRRGR
jgi:uncharacterized protein